MELARQLLQTPVSLLVRLNEFNTQIVRVGFRHLLQPEVSPRAVYIIDASGVSDTNISENNQDNILSMFDVRMHVLKDGDKYNLKTRRPFV